jgi:N-acetylmuramoyl-L-alanine amidase
MFNKRKFPVFVILFFICLSGFVPEEETSYTGSKVVIDPGHGGKDPGNLGTGKYKTYEKDIVLDISLQLGKYIEANFPDVEVLYTRTNDEFVGLKERADLANKNNADLFICIHANSNKSSAPFGTDTWVMGLHKSKANLDLAKRENSSILIEKDYETKYGGYDPNSPEAEIIFSMYQNAYLDQSLELAAKVQKEFSQRAKRRDRGVKQAGFLVLHQTTMPSILIETGFLTNPEEEKFLNSDKGQDYIASAIYRAFKEYKIEMEGISAPVQILEDTQKEVKGVFFSVQIVTSSTQIPLDSPKFMEIDNIREYLSGGWYKYVVGVEKGLTGTYKLQEEIRKKGFKSAFVVAFKNDERIPLQEAVKLLE